MHTNWRRKNRHQSHWPACSHGHYSHWNGPRSKKSWTVPSWRKRRRLAHEQLRRGLWDEVPFKYRNDVMWDIY